MDPTKRPGLLLGCRGCCLSFTVSGCTTRTPHDDARTFFLLKKLDKTARKFCSSQSRGYVVVSCVALAIGTRHDVTFRFLVYCLFCDYCSGRHPRLG